MTTPGWLSRCLADVPPGVVTVTSTVPAEPVGDVAVICELDLTVTAAAGFPDPKSTRLFAVKFEPLIVTDVPPATGPTVGLMLVSVGVCSYVN